MAKKKLKLKFVYDAPVTLSFALVILLLFVLDKYVFKGSLSGQWLLSPTAEGGVLPFAFSDFHSIARLFLHVFGYTDAPFLICNMIFVLLLGPAMEERYGSVIIGIMIFVAALFSGVLNACFCKVPACGAEPVVFMLVLLCTMMHLSRSKVSASSLAVIALFVCMQVMRKNLNGIIGVVIITAGGLCGSLFAFLTSPKARKAKKNEAAMAEFNDANSPRFSVKSTGKTSRFGRKNSYDDSEETVIGSIEL
ncbi:MAG: rhomboid family intramembrane serine protease [Treponema sp.]|nr:rhomboid family intramembrane serine protease [Treponema sp.]